MENVIIGHREALSNWIRQFDTLIDLKKRVYKIQEGLLGIFKWGSYKPLPKLNYVLVFKSFYAKCETCSIDDFENNPNSYYQVSMVHNKNRRIIVHETRSKDEALSFGRNLANELNTPLKDSVSNAQHAKSS
ncbi:MAG: hypothetical protein ABIP51_00970 [Bacteroidia bacterium]